MCSTSSPFVFLVSDRGRETRYVCSSQRCAQTGLIRETDGVVVCLGVSRLEASPARVEADFFSSAPLQLLPIQKLIFQGTHASNLFPLNGNVRRTRLVDSRRREWRIPEHPYVPLTLVPGYLIILRKVQNTLLMIYVMAFQHFSRLATLLPLAVCPENVAGV